LYGYPTPIDGAPRRRRAAIFGVVLVFVGALLLCVLGWSLRGVLPVRQRAPANPPDARWTVAGTLATPRDDFGSAVAAGKIYVFGGMIGERGNRLDTGEIYDPATGRWSPGPTLTGARSSFRAAALGDTIYLVGGSSNERPTIDLVEAFDTTTSRWRTLAPLPLPRFGHGLVALDGRIWAIGGYSGGQGVADVQVYDPATDRWAVGPPLPTPRYNLATVVADGKIWALGGWVGDGPSTRVEVFDPRQGGWSAAPDLTVPMSNFGAAVVADRIHVMHHDAHLGFASAGGRRWLAEEAMPTSRHGQAVVAVGETLYAIGGCYRDPQYDLDVTEALVPR